MAQIEDVTSALSSGGTFVFECAARPPPPTEDIFLGPCAGPIGLGRFLMSEVPTSVDVELTRRAPPTRGGGERRCWVRRTWVRSTAATPLHLAVSKVLNRERRGCSVDIQGYLAHKKRPPPWDHRRALGIGLL
ncbi:hypothetical protein T484DRAFT_3237521 [Baffinella frigidus]|nr:hypothetical protein T484DRAFT_3237521 [Cryptophyta sp. CCMP2293]